MKERIKISGSTLRNEQIKDAQDILISGFEDDVSYNPNFIFYKTEVKIPIKIYDQKYSASFGSICKFLSPHYSPILLGDLLYNTEKNEYWLCIESYDVDSIHYDGKLGKCSRFLKWQDKNGVIQEIPVITRNATQYNNGLYNDMVISIGSDQIMVYTQLNNDTIKLEHGVKFLVDENKERPTVYELTKPDTVDYSYMRKGMMSMMLTEYAYKPSEKELELGVCNYFDPLISNNSSILSKPNIENIQFNTIISGIKKIKIGYRKNYTVKFMDFDSHDINYHEINYRWNIVSDFDIESTIHENKISLLINDENCIGKSFLLQIIVDDKILNEIKIDVISIS